MSVLKYLCVFILSIELVFANCPYECKNNGICKASTCECLSPWSGPDCSVKLCPFGSDWNGNHTNYVECSGRGRCNRETGECICEKNFIGQSCDKLSCPSVTYQDCSGHGKCLSMKQNAELYVQNTKCFDEDPSKDPIIIPYYEDPISSWDANRIHGCRCQSGWKGYDCSIPECPYGAVTYKNHAHSTSYFTIPREKDNTFLATTRSWKITIKNCPYRTATFCPIETFDVSPFINLKKLQDIISANGIVKDVIINSINELPIFNTPGNVIRFIFVSDPNAEVIQVSDNDKNKINSKCFVSNINNNNYKSKNQKFPLLYTILSPAEKVYLECSGIGECIAGKCVNCDNTESTTNPYLLNEDIEYNSNSNRINNCQVSSNQYIKLHKSDEKDLCIWGEYLIYNNDSVSEHNYCKCNPDYYGKSCNKGKCSKFKDRSFFDNPVATNEAHMPNSCSNEGNCNELTNNCICRNGFSGLTCNLMNCPIGSKNKQTCSNHGYCRTMSELYNITENSNFFYWDFTSIGNCDCDEGYTGYNCEERKCPIGPDPLECEDNQHSFFPPYFEIPPLNSWNTLTFHFNGLDTPAITKETLLSDISKYLNDIGVRGPFTYNRVERYEDKITLTIAETYNDNIQVSNLKDNKENYQYNIIYLHSYCNEELIQTQLVPHKSISLLTLTNERNNNIILHKGTVNCYECSKRGICDKESGICKCIKPFSSSNGINLKGITESGNRGDCGYFNPIENLEKQDVNDDL